MALWVKMWSIAPYIEGMTTHSIGGGTGGGGGGPSTIAMEGGGGGGSTMLCISFK